MVLAVDVGNTHTVLGVFRRDSLVADWRIASSTVRTEDEVWIILRLFLDHVGVQVGEISGAVISSVVPSLTGIFEMMVMKYLHRQPVIVSAALDFGMPVKYDPPHAVGADRLCNAVAAYEKYGGPSLVVDFGTATTFDVVSRKGEYLGGVIAPGVETSSIDLQRRTALLPKIDLEFPKSVIGKNTTASMQSGILFGAVDATEGMVKRLKEVIGNNATVVATGGFSKLIAMHTKVIDHVEATLVLEGARLIYQKVKGHHES